MKVLTRRIYSLRVFRLMKLRTKIEGRSDVWNLETKAAIPLI